MTERTSSSVLVIGATTRRRESIADLASAGWKQLPLDEWKQLPLDECDEASAVLRTPFPTPRAQEAPR